MTTGETDPKAEADESNLEHQATETGAEDEGERESEEKKRLNLAVSVEKTGPCLRKIKITIPPEDIEANFNEQFTELVNNAEVPGFRPGHAPRRLIEKKYRKDVAEQVKRQLLMQSLEQVGEEQNIQAISEPKFDVAAIDLPETGPMVYEFDIEVTPEFDLPNYKGLKISRPVKEFGEADVNKQLKKFMESYAQMVPKSGAAETGDFIIADVVFRDGGAEISKASELSLRIQPVLHFRDGTIDQFDKLMAGVQTGDVRSASVTISNEAPNMSLRGRAIEAEFTVKDIKRLRLPELDKEFLDQVGYETEEQLRDALHSVLRRRLEYEQRRVARQQLLDQLTAGIQIELPPDLVKRQVQSTLRRKVMEMRESRMGEDEIRRRYVELQQNSISATHQSLREHFILAKIAEAEKLEVTPEDIDNQIQVMAMQSEESPRRVRARLQKEGLLETLEVQILEQLAVERALEFAEWQNVPLEEEAEVNEEAVDESAGAGEEEPQQAPAAESPTP